ncbi:MAG: aspartate dehydrogenase [Candidatus Omnitrophica bacterium]|nr:aspartate dehydrogenase [Candidatus Omnitrophota bacterium]
MSLSPLRKQAKAKIIRVGILGCGAIGSRIAKSIKTQCDDQAVVTALFDINPAKAQHLQKNIPYKNSVKTSYPKLLESCDLVVEAVNAADTYQLVRSALLAKKDVLVMSVGKFIEGESIFKLAQKQGVRLLIPSGAIAGIDAIKAASLQRIDRIILTTRKPIYGFVDNAYIKEKRVNLSKIKKETILFDGNVREAVKCFPQNINVAATIALASDAKDKLRIRIVTSPEFKVNSHEIEVAGEFGRLVTKTENVVCPDNPKTSYLAVLSAVRTLKEYFQGVKIGT